VDLAGELVKSKGFDGWWFLKTEEMDGESCCGVKVCI